MRFLTVPLLLVLTTAPAWSQEVPADAQEAQTLGKERRAAVSKGLAWLKKAQHEDGHFGATYPVTVTSMVGLALLATEDDPLADPSLLAALGWLLPRIKAGYVPGEGHTWIHGQGFATLFLSELYGRAKLSKRRPKIDVDSLLETVHACVNAIEVNQSASGGWWYKPGGGDQHEGSTTVCAVQALRSASNFGVETDPKVMAKGFEYLKRSQNADGSFQYRLGDGSHMQEGTAAAIATLAMMEKADYPVLMRGVKHLGTLGHAAITGARFPYYGHFYSVLGMKLVDDEMGGGLKIPAGWYGPLAKWLTTTQGEDGGWPLLSWLKGRAPADQAYATSLAVLILAIRDERLSIFKRPALYIYEKD